MVDQTNFPSWQSLAWGSLGRLASDLGPDFDFVPGSVDSVDWVPVVEAVAVAVAEELVVLAEA